MIVESSRRVFVAPPGLESESNAVSYSVCIPARLRIVPSAGQVNGPRSGLDPSGRRGPRDADGKQRKARTAPSRESNTTQKELATKQSESLLMESAIAREQGAPQIRRTSLSRLHTNPLFVALSSRSCFSGLPDKPHPMWRPQEGG